MAPPTNFVTRSQWGSSFNYGRNTRMPSTCSGVALHWEGSPMGTFTHDQCNNKVRSIEAYHTHTKGWHRVQRARLPSRLHLRRARHQVSVSRQW